MAKIFILLSLLFLSFFTITNQQEQQENLPLQLSQLEQHTVYKVLSSINSDIPWQTLFPPDDFCFSPPHGIICDYFSSPENDTLFSLHIAELSFGYVSDYSPNPPCSSNSTLHPLIFTSFKYLRKLFFYKCFTQTTVLLPNVSKTDFGSSENLEELVFIENPSLVGSIDGIIGNFTGLRRLVLSGNGVYGNILSGFISNLVNIEEITLSRNKLSGEFPLSLTELKRLKILDLSQNQFDGNVPDSIGNMSNLLKLDLSSNGFFGKIPEGMSNLGNLEFLDLSFNRFGNFGIPLCLGKMSRLKEVYLTGNLLGGKIPEIWKNLGGINGIGFANMGLIGKIPSSMGVYLKNLSYLRLDNNKLEGNLPKELELLSLVSEINLENNNLSGEIPFTANFTARIGEKLKLNGNSRLCKSEGSLVNLKVCSNKSDFPNMALFKENSSDSVSLSSQMQVFYSPYGVIFLGFYMSLLW